MPHPVDKPTVYEFARRTLESNGLTLRAVDEHEYLIAAPLHGVNVPYRVMGALDRDRIEIDGLRAELASLVGNAERDRVYHDAIREAPTRGAPNSETIKARLRHSIDESKAGEKPYRLADHEEPAPIGGPVFSREMIERAREINFARDPEGRILARCPTCHEVETLDRAHTEGIDRHRGPLNLDADGRPLVCCAGCTGRGMTVTATEWKRVAGLRTDRVVVDRRDGTKAVVGVDPAKGPDRAVLTVCGGRGPETIASQEDADRFYGKGTAEAIQLGRMVEVMNAKPQIAAVKIAPMSVAVEIMFGAAGIRNATIMDNGQQVTIEGSVSETAYRALMGALSSNTPRVLKLPSRTARAHVADICVFGAANEFPARARVAFEATEASIIAASAPIAASTGWYREASVAGPIPLPVLTRTVDPATGHMLAPTETLCTLAEIAERIERGEQIEVRAGKGVVTARKHAEGCYRVLPAWCPLGYAPGEIETAVGCLRDLVRDGYAGLVLAPDKAANRIGDVYRVVAGRFEITAFVAAPSGPEAVGVFTTDAGIVSERIHRLPMRGERISAGYGPNCYGEPHPLKPFVDLLATLGRIAIVAAREEQRRSIKRLLDAEVGPFVHARRAAVMAAVERRPDLDPRHAAAVLDACDAYEAHRGIVRDWLALPAPRRLAILTAARSAAAAPADVVSWALGVYERERGRCR
jgi:hypothetical protein